MAQMTGTFVTRVWRQGIGPALAHLRGEVLYDITTKAAPTMRDLLELPDIAAHLTQVAGEPIGRLDDLTAASTEAFGDTTRLLSPADLQAIKACGVTFARSMIERVIEERAAGDASRASAIRERIAEILGTSLRNLRPGSPQAAEVKKVLITEGLWSQYLEVGIGPDAEVFTKAPPMASVGQGATIGLHPVSKWNNPEPEVVLAVNAQGVIRGVTLGNDVNLRDVEGRSALLLGKAKDNNASAAIGPMIRLFDDSFSLDDVRQMTPDLDRHRAGWFHLARQFQHGRDQPRPRRSGGANHGPPSPISRWLHAVLRHDVLARARPRWAGARVYPPFGRCGYHRNPRTWQLDQHRAPVNSSAGVDLWHRRLDAQLGWARLFVTHP
jgi:fumarylacetoacetate (FAA) hydrolase family protein